MANQITPNPSVPSQVVADGLKFPQVIQNLGIIPTSYKDSMSYYETLTWLCKYLEETVIPTVNQNGNAVQELQNLYIELNSYVANYFDNLDVQEEINNKLDEMASSGVLQEIISSYLQTKAIFAFNNVEDMKNAENLIAGSFAKTSGYYSINDGGSANYKIRNRTFDDVIDNGLIILMNNKSLVAELIIENEINIKQFGAKGDGIADDTLPFKIFTNSNIKKLIIPEGTYNLTDILTFDNKELIGIGNSSLNYISQTTLGEHYIRFKTKFYCENITFNQLVHNTSVVGLFNCSFSEFKNCKFIADGYKCGSELDLYTNNHDIVINNCYFKLKSYNSNNIIQAGGIWVREFLADKETYNITFNDCVVIHDSKDESIACWNWNGHVHDVVLNNCKIIGEETNTASWFITFNVENSSINNCYIENKNPNLFSGMFNNNENETYENILVNNSIIKINSFMQNGFAIFKLTLNNCNIFSTNTFNNGSLSIFNNCVLNVKKPQLGGGIYNSCIFKGDENPLSTAQFIFLNNLNGILELNNCKFEKFVIEGTNLIFAQLLSDFNSIIIKNTEFDLDFNSIQWFIFGNTNIDKLEITNSNIKKPLFLTGEVNGYIANNITTLNISAFSHVKVNNNFNINS